MLIITSDALPAGFSLCLPPPARLPIATADWLNEGKGRNKATALLRS